MAITVSESMAADLRKEVKEAVEELTCLLTEKGCLSLVKWEELHRGMKHASALARNGFKFPFTILMMGVDSLIVVRAGGQAPDSDLYDRVLRRICDELERSDPNTNLRLEAIDYMAKNLAVVYRDEGMLKNLARIRFGLDEVGRQAWLKFFTEKMPSPD